MTKYEFLNIIASGLSDFPKQELQDILYDYEEHFRNGYADGKSDEEILRELGDPYKIVNQYRSQYIQKYDTSSNNNNNNSSDENTASKVFKVILLVLLAIILGPTLIGVLFTVLGIFVGLVSTAFAITVTCLSTLAGKFGILLGFSIPTYIANIPTSVNILLSIGSIAGTILVIILIIYFIKAIIVLIKKLINYLKNRGGI